MSPLTPRPQPLLGGSDFPPPSIPAVMDPQRVLAASEPLFEQGSFPTVFALGTSHVVAPLLFAILAVAQSRLFNRVNTASNDLVRRKSWTVARVLCLVLQVGIAAVLLADLANHSYAILGEEALEAGQLAMHIASFAAAFCNIGTVVEGQSRTASAAYHAVSCLVWGWQSKPGHRSIETRIDHVLPIVYATALALDVLTSSTTAAEPRHDLDGGNVLERATCAWLNPLLLSKQALEPAALPAVGLPDAFPAYQAAFTAACLGSNGPVGAFFSFLVRNHALTLAIAAVLRLADDLSMLAVPFLLRWLLMAPTVEKLLVQLVSRVAGALLGSLARIMSREVAVGVKAVVSAVVHDKTLRLDMQRGDSEISTLSEVDSETLFTETVDLNDFWSLPLQLLLYLVGLGFILPWEGVVAVAILSALLLPTMRVLTNRMTRFVKVSMTTRDGRTKLTTEVLRCIRSIKLHAWEPMFEAKLDEKRAVEMAGVRSVAVLNAFLVSFMQLIPPMLALTAFSIALWRQTTFDSQLVFPAQMLILMIHQAVQMAAQIPFAIAAIRTSMGRLKSHLAGSEANHVEKAGLDEDEDITVEMDQVELKWPGGASILTNASMVVKKGEMVVISGPTGSGKSSMLLSLLSYLEPAAGSVMVRGRVAYVPQHPFLISATVKQNILFGKQLHQTLYDRVVEACALTQDMQALALGDQTVLDGDVALSGGQKARVCLARALYAEADVYVMDDPLSAVDMDVQRGIVRHVFSPSGMLAKATRVVASNTATLLAESTSIVHVISDGTLVRRDKAFDGSDTSHEHREVESTVDVLPPLPGPLAAASSVQEAVLCHVAGSHRVSALPSLPVESLGPADVDETATTTSMPVTTDHPILRYFSYARFGGWVVTMGSLMLARLISLGANLALKNMTTETSTSGLVRDLALYAVLGAVQALFFFVFIVALFRLCMLPAGRRLHADMVRAVLSLPLAFFETVPTGEVLNRFTNDLARVDGSLNGLLVTLTAQLANLGLTCAVLVVAAPTSLTFLVPLAAACCAVQGLYLKKLRELRRLQVATRGPVLTYVQEADRGRVLFAVFGLAAARAEAFASLLANNLRAALPAACIDVWLGARLEMLGVAVQVLAFAGLLVVGVDSATVGFVMAYVFQITAYLAVITRAIAGFEGDVVSLKRVQEYISIDVSAAENTEHAEQERENNDEVDDSWPAHGAIHFDSFSTRYRPGLPLSLRSVDLSINPGEKVAVVGRTGAGKSSLVLALLGLLLPVAGRVLVDGVALPGPRGRNGEAMRRRVALIPQAPVVWPATLRENVDPRGEWGDHDIMDAVRKARVDVALRRLGEGSDLLHARLKSGSELSGGEVQLVALARALLRKSKVVILDEATAGLDLDTEATVHDVVRRHFADATIIAVMHRLRLTVTYDKVLVLANGSVVSFGSPAALLAEPRGVYFSMMEAAGLLEDARAALSSSGKGAMMTMRQMRFGDVDETMDQGSNAP